MSFYAPYMQEKRALVTCSASGWLFGAQNACHCLCCFSWYKLSFKPASRYNCNLSHVVSPIQTRCRLSWGIYWFAPWWQRALQWHRFDGVQNAPSSSASLLVWWLLSCSCTQCRPSLLVVRDVKPFRFSARSHAGSTIRQRQLYECVPSHQSGTSK